MHFGPIASSALAQGPHLKMTVRSLRSLPELAVYEGAVCTSQHFMPGIWQNREFVLECIYDQCLDLRTSFRPDSVSLQFPLASMWPVRGRGGGGAKWLQEAVWKPRARGGCLGLPWAGRWFPKEKLESLGGRWL